MYETSGGKIHFFGIEIVRESASVDYKCLFPNSIKELEMLKESILEITKGISCYEKSMASIFPKKPTKEAVQEALNNRNGRVYVIENKYKKTDTIPPDATLGAWKVNSVGVITGNFIPNPNHKKEY